MDYPFSVGDVKELTFTVTHSMTAAAFASGTLEVLATPYMIAKMEETAASLIIINDGLTSSVGTTLHVRHVAATPIGMRFTTKAQITKIDGRAVTFDIYAYDEAGLIGEGTHERVLINIERFMEKTYNKLKN